MVIMLINDISFLDTRRDSMPRYNSIKAGELTDTSYYILLCLTKKKHGYLIMQTIKSLTSNQFSIGPASMYTTIKKLLEADLIELSVENSSKKKTYVATMKGIELLKKEVERRKAMVEHAEKILNQYEGV